ncbi:hypothetical protein DL98DRAFT_593467 [Cadophora sp. DSE1049]|nr:hypothetical protein DL98DRAFT_593467 [Cadophora sp. DSE1049]
MAPKLELCFTMRGYMDKANSHDLKTMKAGPTRIMVPMTHGFIKGSGLQAKLTPGGGDWILLDTSLNVAHLDVRTQARTDDGESVYVHYNGILKIDEAGSKVLAWAKDAKTTNFGDHYWFSGPIIETSSKEFKWVENTAFVGQGRFIVDDDGAEAVEYEIYKVTN